MDFSVKLEIFPEKVRGEKKIVPVLVYCIYPQPGECRWGSTGEKACGGRAAVGKEIGLKGGKRGRGRAALVILW